MIEQTDRERREALRAHYADEEAENAAAEAAEAGAEDKAVLSVRVPTSLAEALKSRAAAEPHLAVCADTPTADSGRAPRR